MRERDLRLRGYVRYASAGSGQLEVQVDIQAPIAATLENPVGQLTAWRAVIELPEPMATTPSL